jgi:hypothetical protein
VRQIGFPRTLMAQLDGFTLETRHVDWVGAEFTADSRSQVLVYRIPPSPQCSTEGSGEPDVERCESFLPHNEAWAAAGRDRRADGRRWRATRQRRAGAGGETGRRRQGDDRVHHGSSSLSGSVASGIPSRFVSHGAPITSAAVGTT